MSLLAVGPQKSYPLHGFNAQETLLCGSFQPSSAAAPVKAPFSDTGWVVTHVATGRFLVKFIGSMGVGVASLGLLKSIKVSLQQNAVSKLMAIVKTVTGSSFEIDIVAADTGVLTDITLNANNLIHWMLDCSLNGQLGNYI